ncbi:MAG: trigger factor [Candidatus Pacebacteria bacterium]|jgi:trigger factor|nr:trigger factor [Candidatus Paceibacterota bacterium]
MENTIKDLEKSQKEISVTVSDDEMQKHIEKATEEISKSVKLDGFRQGKVPKDIVKQKVGMEKIYEEAAHMAIEETYLEILKATPEMIPLGQPKAEIIKMAPGNDFEYKMTISVMPAVKLGDYKKVTGKAEVKEVEESRIDAELENLRKRRAAYITKDEPAAKDDRVEIDFEVRVGGVKIEGGESKNHPLIVGEDKFIPGFEEKLVGMKKDDIKEFELQFPADYKADLAGKMASFKVTMDSVQKVEKPELNDEFAQGLGKVKDLAELKSNLRKNMEAEEKAHADHELEHELIDQVVKDMEADIPQILIDSEVTNMIAEFKGNISQAGMDFDTYLANAKATVEGLREEWKPSAEKKVKEHLAIREVALRENIKAEDDEITEKVDETLKHYPNAEEIRGKIDMSRFRDYIAGDILKIKVVKFLQELAEKN